MSSENKLIYVIRLRENVTIWTQWVTNHNVSLWPVSRAGKCENVNTLNIRLCDSVCDSENKLFYVIRLRENVTIWTQWVTNHNVSLWPVSGAGKCENVNTLNIRLCDSVCDSENKLFYVIRLRENVTIWTQWVTNHNVSLWPVSGAGKCENVNTLNIRLCDSVCDSENKLFYVIRLRENVTIWTQWVTNHNASLWPVSGAGKCENVNTLNIRLCDSVCEFRKYTNLCHKIEGKC